MIQSTYLLIVNNKDTRAMLDVVPLFSNVVLVSLLLTLNTPCSTVSIANFKQVIDNWEKSTV